LVGGNVVAIMNRRWTESRTRRAPIWRVYECN
jgi:hypothetical protein